MRIGIYDPYLDDLGGGEKYMMTIAQCLSTNHNVDVFWDEREDLEKVQMRFALDSSKINLTKNIFSPNVSTLERMKESRKYDVIIVLSDGSIPVVLSKKVILHIQQPINPNLVSGIKTKLKLSRVNAIFYNSKFSSTFNEKIFPKIKSKIIYPPVEINYENVTKENIIMHVGRFRVIEGKTTDYKKQQVMVDAFKKMIDDGLQGWKLVVATSIQDEKNKMFQQMLQSAKGYPIEFFINKTNKEVWNLYNRAKIYWHASGYGENLETHPEYAEHFGISTVEAMGAGAVPIVINAGGQREIVEDNKNGLFWNTLTELEEKTFSITRDKALWQILSDQSRTDAKKFSRDIFCEEINKLITQ